MRRTFLGLPVSEEMSRQLALLIENRRGVRWIPRRNLHLTIEFLGPASESQIEQLSEALRRIDSTSLTLGIEGLRCLPTRGNPRVLALALAATEEFAALYRLARSAADETRFALKPPRLSPHVTVARLKRPDAEWLAGYLRRQSPSVEALGPYRADVLNLYESRLSPAGAEYFVLRRFPLRAG